MSSRIIINSAEDLRFINDNTLHYVDLNSLLNTYRLASRESEPGLLFTTALTLISRQKKQYSNKWVLNNFGMPDYVGKDGKKTFYYYLYINGKDVGCIDIFNNMFAGFGIIDRAQFEQCLKERGLVKRVGRGGGKAALGRVGGRD